MKIEKDYETFFFKLCFTSSKKTRMKKNKQRSIFDLKIQRKKNWPLTKNILRLHKKIKGHTKEKQACNPLEIEKK